jgi:hypothetical protein
MPDLLPDILVASCAGLLIGAWVALEAWSYRAKERFKRHLVQQLVDQELTRILFWSSLACAAGALYLAAVLAMSLWPR